jgi:hypothetical protein
MTTEQYVVTCKLEDNQVGYRAANAFDFPPNTYNFYGVNEIGKLEYYEKEAQKYTWDLARMIANSPEYADVRRIFGVDSINDVYKMPFDSVLKICQAWENRIKVGDVCLAERSDGKTEKVVVLSAGSPDAPDVLVLRKNMQTTLVGTDNLTQTGESLANELNYILRIIKED